MTRQWIRRAVRERRRRARPVSSLVPPPRPERAWRRGDMARILVQGDDLVMRLAWWEKAAARRGGVRVPLTAVRRVTVEPSWWRALRGVVLHGVWIPGVLCVGRRSHPGGQDFVAVRPGRPVVCVELRPTAPFSLLAVSVRDDAEAVAERLRRCTPDNDASTPWRQPLPAAEETENSWRALAREPRRRRRSSVHGRISLPAESCRSISARRAIALRQTSRAGGTCRSAARTSRRAPVNRAQGPIPHRVGLQETTPAGRQSKRRRGRHTR